MPCAEEVWCVRSSQALGLYFSLSLHMCDIIGVSPSIDESLLKQPLTDSGIKQEEEVEEEEERLLRSELYLIEGTH